MRSLPPVRRPWRRDIIRCALFRTAGAVRTCCTGPSRRISPNADGSWCARSIRMTIGMTGRASTPMKRRVTGHGTSPIPSTRCSRTRRGVPTSTRGASPWSVTPWADSPHSRGAADSHGPWPGYRSIPAPTSACGLRCCWRRPSTGSALPGRSTGYASRCSRWWGNMMRSHRRSACGTFSPRYRRRCR